MYSILRDLQTYCQSNDCGCKDTELHSERRILLPELNEGRRSGFEKYYRRSKIENIAVITDFVNSILEANGCSAKVQMEIDIAIDEIFGNIAYYAYTPKTGEATVQVEIKNFPERLELTFIDKGIPYNPLENKDPDVTLDIEKRKIGGLGIFSG